MNIYNNFNTLHIIHTYVYNCVLNISSKNYIYKAVFHNNVHFNFYKKIYRVTLFYIIINETNMK